MRPQPSEATSSQSTRIAPWWALAVTCLWVIGCNDNTLTGSSRSTQPNGPTGVPGGPTPDDPSKPKGDSVGDRSNGTDRPKPADKIDDSSVEACKKTLLTSGFKDPVNGRVYRMLEGEHTYCKGHKLCDDIDASARFPMAGEEASDEIMRCSGYFKTWLDERADSKKELCDDGRSKDGRNLALSDPDRTKNLSLYTFEYKGAMDINNQAPIFCVYKE